MPDPWKPDRQWTVAEVRDVVRHRCAGVECQHVKPFGCGWDNAAFLCDKTWIFRFAQRRVAVPLLMTEWSVLPHLSTCLPVPIPDPKWFGQVDGWPFVGYRLLNGLPASDLVIDTELRCELARPLGRFLRALHSQPFADLAVVPDPLGRFNIAPRTTRAEEMLAECGSDVEATGLRRILAEVDPTPGEAVLSHGDLYSRHLLVENRQLSGVIDWGDVCVADRAHDLMLPFCFLPPESRKDFFAEYGHVSTSTISRARFRAVGHALNVYLYARSIADRSLLAEAALSLQFLVA